MKIGKTKINYSEIFKVSDTFYLKIIKLKYQSTGMEEYSTNRQSIIGHQLL